MKKPTPRKDRKKPSFNPTIGQIVKAADDAGFHVSVTLGGETIQLGKPNIPCQHVYRPAMLGDKHPLAALLCRNCGHPIRPWVRLPTASELALLAAHFKPTTTTAHALKSAMDLWVQATIFCLDHEQKPR